MKEIKLKNLLIFLTYLISLICILLTSKAIDKFYFLIITFLFLISLFFEKHQRFCPKIIINIMGMVFILLFLITTNLSNLLENSLKTLTFILALKFLEEKKVRDYLEIYLICFLILAGCSYFYTTFLFFLILIFLLFLLNTCLFLCLFILEKENLIFSLRTLTKIFYINFIPFFSLFLSIIFFIFLPRLSSPLFNLNIEQTKAKTGFSEQLTIGSFSEVQESNSIVLRAEMEKIELEELYWRGTTLEYFDGKKWNKKNENLFMSHRIFFLNPPKIKQTLYLTLPQENYLLALDKPVVISGNIQYEKTSDLSIKLLESKSYPIRYYVYSVIGDIIEEKIDKKIFLQLPPLNPEVEELAKSLKGKDEEETAKNIINFFKEKEFKYSLKNLPISQKPLEDFLFKYKYGNCEYFASAMAIFLRINGIPSRLVVGYKGGEYNEWGKYYVVKEKNAHTWVEAYVKGKWKRYDPTPSVTIFHQSSFLKEKIIAMLDLINYYYYKFILDYNLQMQIKLLKTFRAFFLNTENIKIASIKSFNKSLLIKIFVLFLSSIILYLSYRNIKKQNLKILLPLEKRLLLEFLKILKKFGYSKADTEGLEELLAKIKEPILKDKSQKIVKILERYLYKDKKMDKVTYQQLKTYLKEIENLK